MKQIFLVLMTFISFNCVAQVNELYAIKGNLDGTLDSFYVKRHFAGQGDSVFNSNGVFALRTKRFYDNMYQPVFPLSFGRFFFCADNVWRNAIALYGVKTETFLLNSNAGANLVLTDHPNSEQGLANSSRSAIRVQTHGYTEARLTVIVIQNSTSVNNPRLYFQYSLDGTNWIGGGSGISLATNGAKETAWTTLPEGAIGDIYIRVAQNGGNGTADPSVGTVAIQFR